MTQELPGIDGDMSSQQSDTHNQLSRKSRSHVWLSLWAISVAGGMLALTSYSTAPGQQVNAARQRPASSALGFHSDVPTLFVFLHPRCSCSRATVSELSRLLATNPRCWVRGAVCFPGGVDDSWADTTLVTDMAQLSDVAPFADHHGRECHRFGARTSGHVMLYSRSGTLLFSGGITSGRGHEGDNPGLDQLRRALDGEVTNVTEFPVFGCPLGVSEEWEDEA